MELPITAATDSAFQFSSLDLEERKALWVRLRSERSTFDFEGLRKRGFARLEEWRAAPGFQLDGAFGLFLAQFKVSENDLAEILALELRDVTPDWLPPWESFDFDTAWSFTGFKNGIVEKSLREVCSSKLAKDLDAATYPVLARQQNRQMRLRFEAGVELLARLQEDFDGLERRFGSLRELNKLELGAGDSHCGGRSVALLSFAGGQTIVYKPRPLAAEVHFAELVDWLNESGLEHRLRAPVTWDRGPYGWCEFIPQQACEDEAALTRFYHRQGSWLALFYFLSGRDLHSENIRACGEHPVPIDLEMIFCPRTEDQKILANPTPEERLLESVLSVGLLPAPRLSGGLVYEGSGLGGVTTSHGHRPSLSGAFANAALFREDVTAGFERTYRIFLESRDSVSKVLARFIGDQTRLILRPTATYAVLLADSYHPELLRDGLQRELYFSQLWWEGAARETLRPFVWSERRQLLDGDVPYFTTTTASRDVQGVGASVDAAMGSEKDLLESVPRALAQSGFEVSSLRLARASAADLATQRWIIETSLSLLETLQPRSDRRSHGFKTSARTSEQIGDWLLDLELTREKERPEWLTLEFTKDVTHGDSYLSLQPIREDLYSGRAGVCFFLGYLGAATNQSRFELAAKQIYSSLRPVTSVVGGFSGLGAHIFLSAHVAKLWGEPLSAGALEAIAKLRGLAEKDTHLDLVSGTAGAVLSVLAASVVQPHLVTTAEALGDLLLANSTVDGQFRSWPRLAMPRGFSHGTSGISYALSELGARTGKARFTSAALEALCGEERLLQEKWTDLEGPAGSPQVSWCHGAAGIAMSRLNVYARTRDTEALQGAERALENAMINPWPANESLCHGSLGNLEMLKVASQILAGRWTKQYEIKRDELSRLLELRTPHAQGTATPGFMTGLSGIGYALLPGDLPSVLLLEGPK